MSRVLKPSHEPGAPVPEGMIPLSVPEIGGNAWAYVKECLDTGWVSSAGPFVTRFEREVAAAVGARHAVATVSGTAALHIALLVSGVRPDDEVIVSNLTFVAPVNAVRYCQAHPILMDADPGTWQMDSAKLEQFLQEECELREEGCFNRRTGRRVRAVLPVHLLGLACEVDRIVALARRHRLQVVEDACEGMGARYRGQHVGTFGDVAALSFNGNKVITAGGGGMVVTNDSARADYARYLTTQAKDDGLEFIHHEVGYNYRLANIQAALGVAQLEMLPEFVSRKRAIARAYQEALRGVPGITLMPTPPHCDPTYWLYTILLPGDASLDQRKAVLKDLHAHGVGARPLWHTIHDLPPYRHCQAYQIQHSVRLYQRAVSLPSSVGLRMEDLRQCADALAGSVARVLDPSGPLPGRG